MEPAVDAYYVIAFVGKTRRPGDEMYGIENGMEDQPESYTTDGKVDEEIAMARMDASPNLRRHIK